METNNPQNNFELPWTVGDQQGTLIQKRFRHFPVFPDFGWHGFSPVCYRSSLVLQRHVRQLSMTQVIIFQVFKSFLRISIRTWLMDQNPCETSHFLAIGVLTQRRSTRDVFPLASLVLHSAGKKPRPRRLTAVLTSRWSNGSAALSPSCEPTLHRSDRKSRELPPHRSHEG